MLLKEVKNLQAALEKEKKKKKYKRLQRHNTKETKKGQKGQKTTATCICSGRIKAKIPEETEKSKCWQKPPVATLLDRKSVV